MLRAARSVMHYARIKSTKSCILNSLWTLVKFICSGKGSGLFLQAVYFTNISWTVLENKQLAGCIYRRLQTFKFLLGFQAQPSQRQEDTRLRDNCRKAVRFRDSGHSTPRPQTLRCRLKSPKKKPNQIENYKVHRTWYIVYSM